MTIEQKYIDLINADIDGEISASAEAELQTFLDENAEGQALHTDLSSLCATLHGVESEEPPPHLRHVIMNSVKSTRTSEERRGFLQILFATPAVKYTVTFAAGVFLTLSIVNSNQVSDRAFDDVTGLVGTVAEPIDTSVASSISVTKPDIAGTVSLRSKDSLLILDFDLVAKDHVDIEANYTDRSIWFNGFAQLESEGTTISADTGRIRMGMDGKRRYAIYLHNQSGRQATVNLRFLADGKVVHEATLDYTPAQ